MRTDEDSEIEYAVMKQVASVTIESDSQAENVASTLSSRSNRRRKKRRVDREGTNQTTSEHMDIDTPSSATPTKISLHNNLKNDSKNDNIVNRNDNNNKKSMDWDGVYSASELSSSETFSSDGREADDEQSDWVDSTESNVHDYLHEHPSQNLNGRQQRMNKAHTPLALLHRKLERFVRDDNQQELVLYQWMRSNQLSRILHCFGLEIAKRTRGTLIVKKKKSLL
ncbi:unnamed protein product [Anisakis simplex]|uniref:Protein encore n=1 Tax=Anisakis simplex TaxID=6269 RepID=A0A0M3IYP4_ANISI|nr:unnamed protein product [Anisakis simplex]